ncbi:hypothetical protein [Aureimonas psammosilenae]|uniref:hypothetical protein n=1 Tax=Aureimonas psammosilenae TaxID=2495496 RepID=UPI00186AA56D|nr:hypothetical protein [Aureimonas psammosilenae]
MNGTIQTVAASTAANAMAVAAANRFHRLRTAWRTASGRHCELAPWFPGGEGSGFAVADEARSARASRNPIY